MAKRHSEAAVDLRHTISDSDWRECATSSISHTAYYSAAQSLDDGARQRLVSAFVAGSDLREDFKELWHDLSSAKVKTVYLPIIFVDVSVGASHTRKEAQTLYWSGNTEYYTLVDVIERGYGANSKRSMHPVLKAMGTRESKEARGSAEFDTMLWSETAFKNARDAALYGLSFLFTFLATL